MDLLVEFERVVGCLHGRVDYALCGGLAVAVHGAPRATRDIDLIVREEDVEAVYALLEPLGYRHKALPMTFPDGMRLRRVTRIRGRDVSTIDLLLVGPATEAAFASRRPFQVGEHEVWVAGREELIGMKVLAGRPQDLADVERLRGDDR